MSDEGMKVVKKEFTGMLPAAPGTCPECATAHDPQLPHNERSLFWMYRFYQANGRWPTRDDAFAHVSPEIRQAWETAEAELLSKNPLLARTGTVDLPENGGDTTLPGGKSARQGGPASFARKSTVSFTARRKDDHEGDV